MITEVTKYYIEGEGDPNGILTLADGYPNMPTIYYDSTTSPVTTYNFFSALSSGQKWRKPTITTNGYRQYVANFIRVNNPDIYEIQEVINTFGNSIPMEVNVIGDGWVSLYSEDSFDLPLSIQTSLIGENVFEEELYSISHKFSTTSNINIITKFIYHDLNFPVEIADAGYKHVPYSAFETSGFSISIIMKDF